VNAAIVLCGGHSRRMGHDKCLIRLGHSTLLGHVLRTLHESVETVCVVGRHPQRAEQIIPSEFYGTTSWVVDAGPDLGPLEGLRAGMASLPKTAQFAFVCGCDSPLITPRFVEGLFHSVGDYQAVVPWIDESLYPLPAVYSCGIWPQINDQLARNELSLWRLAERLNVRRLTREEIDVFDPGLQSLLNVNDPATLETVSQIWAQRAATLS